MIFHLALYISIKYAATLIIINDYNYLVLRLDLEMQYISAIDLLFLLHFH
jgi:hypothetical protein